jgi:hypothetical protein
VDKEAAEYKLNSSNCFRGVGSSVERRPSRDDGRQDLRNDRGLRCKQKRQNKSKALEGVVDWNAPAVCSGSEWS